jgi:hypothetical protein
VKEAIMSNQDQKLTVKLSDPSQDRKDWQAEDEESDIPVFMRDGSEGHKGNPQDEKDTSAE